MNYPEEKNTYIDGIPCQYLCHVEVTKKAGTVFPAHYHYYIELLYALSGSFLVYLNGTYHEFSAGDMVLINSRECIRSTRLLRMAALISVCAFCRI